MTKPDHSLSDGEGGHTPGPWEHEGDTVFVTEYMQLCCGRGYHSCCGDPEIEVEQRQIAQCAPANARLISAAPDLLEALKLVTQSTEWPTMERDTQDAVLAAIAKAEAAS